MGRFKSPIIAAIASAGLTAALVGGVAIAQTSNEIIACVAENSGNVRIVTSADDCKPNENDMSWSEQGPAGQDATAPAGAVMFFNLTSCPTGWSEMTSARGRYLVGLPSDGVLGGIAGSPLRNLENRPVGRHTHTVSDPGHSHRLDAKSDTLHSGVTPQVAAGNAGITNGLVTTRSETTGITVNPVGSIDGTNAPYLQLLVCQKD